MQLKVFSFNKTEKNILFIEDQLNDFLSNVKFKFASQSENVTKSKLFISIFYENKKSDIKAKVFKSLNPSELEKNVNSFLSNDKVLKFSCQSSGSNNIFMTIFYESRKTNDTPEENQNEG